MIIPFSCVKEKLGFVNCVLIPEAASVSRVFEGDVPPPNGCGSSMTRTSKPRLAASSSTRITLRSVDILPRHESRGFHRRRRRGFLLHQRLPSLVPCRFGLTSLP